MIRSIELENFRNYAWEEVLFGAGLNVIIGKNGRGKTNLVEAVFLLCQGKSMRTREPRELIRRGEEEARVSGVFVGETESRVTRIIREEGIRVGAGERGGTAAVCFQPEDIWIIKGGPERRRRAIDEVAASLRAGYRSDLQEYQRVLRQRNEAIKQIRKGKARREAMRSWNPLLYDRGADIVRVRELSLREIEERMGAIADEWGKGRTELRYYKTMDDAPENPERTLERIARMEEAEIRRGTTLMGPHRDEITFSTGGIGMRRGGSQGEQKMIAIMWRLSQAALIMERGTGEVIPLMDDCLSELDEENRELVIGKMERWGQGVITTTDDRKRFSRYVKIDLNRDGSGDP